MCMPKPFQDRHDNIRWFTGSRYGKVRGATCQCALAITSDVCFSIYDEPTAAQNCVPPPPHRTVTYCWSKNVFIVPSLHRQWVRLGTSARYLNYKHRISTSTKSIRSRYHSQSENVTYTNRMWTAFGASETRRLIFIIGRETIFVACSQI